MSQPLGQTAVEIFRDKLNAFSNFRMGLESEERVHLAFSGLMLSFESAQRELEPADFVNLIQAVDALKHNIPEDDQKRYRKKLTQFAWENRNQIITTESCDALYKILTPIEKIDKSNILQHPVQLDMQLYFYTIRTTTPLLQENADRRKRLDAVQEKAVLFSNQVREKQKAVDTGFFNQLWGRAKEMSGFNDDNSFALPYELPFIEERNKFNKWKPKSFAPAIKITTPVDDKDNDPRPLMEDEKTPVVPVVVPKDDEIKLTDPPKPSPATTPIKQYGLLSSVRYAFPSSLDNKESTDSAPSRLQTQQDQYFLLHQMFGLDSAKSTKTDHSFTLRVIEDHVIDPEQIAGYISKNMKFFKEMLENFPSEKIKDQNLREFLEKIQSSTLSKSAIQAFFKNQDDFEKTIAFFDLLRLELAEDLYGMVGAKRLQKPAHLQEHWLAKFHLASLDPAARLDPKTSEEIGQLLSPELLETPSETNAPFDPFDPAHVLKRTVFKTTSVDSSALQNLAFSQMHFTHGDPHSEEKNSEPTQITISPVSHTPPELAKKWQDRQIRDIMTAILNMKDETGHPEKSERATHLIFKDPDMAVKIPGQRDQLKGHFKFEFFKLAPDGTPDETQPIKASESGGLYKQASEQMTRELLTHMTNSVLLCPPHAHKTYKAEHAKKTGIQLESPAPPVPTSHRSKLT